MVLYLQSTEIIQEPNCCCIKTETLMLPHWITTIIFMVLLTCMLVNLRSNFTPHFLF